MLRIAERRWAARHTSFGNGQRKADRWASRTPARVALRALGAAVALAALLALVVLLALAMPEAAHADTIYYTYTLQWTAPGDDSLFGRARSYDLRYSLSPITTANWSSTPAFPGVPVPQSPGTKESFTMSGLDARYDYYVAMRTADDLGNWSKISNVLIVHTPQPVGASGDTTRIAFTTPWPNPASSEARFSYQLPRPGAIEIDALDVAGRRVRSLASGMRPTGRGQVLWDLTDGSGGRVAPGVYLIRARLLDQVVTKRLIVAR